MKSDNRSIDATQRQTRQQGFSLIELMIVVAVLGIIAAIAVPSYSDYQRKSRRSDAHKLLMQIVAKQEQYFQDNRSYSDDFTKIGSLAASSVAAGSVTSDNNYYTVTIALGTAAAPYYSYVLTATPVAGTSQASDSCTTLTIDQDGTKGFTPPTAKGCW